MDLEFTTLRKIICTTCAESTQRLMEFVNRPEMSRCLGGSILIFTQVLSLGVRPWLVFGAGRSASSGGEDAADADDSWTWEDVMQLQARARARARPSQG